MKTPLLLVRSLAVSTLVVLLTSGVVASIQAQPKVSDAESKASAAVKSAPDINAKIAAAEEFVKKFPKSTLRAQLAEYIVDQIIGVSDANQKVTLAQKYPTIFTDATEVDLIKPALIDAYAKLNRFDEAFADGATYLTRNGEDIQVLVMLAIHGVEQAKARNPKFVSVSKQYGAKAIELIEADKKPASMDAEFWAKEKSMLPQVYQEMAVISLMEQNPTEAQAKLEKASALNPGDPFNHALLGSIINDDYQKLAQTYKNMPEGKSKDEMLGKANALLDKVIEHYVRGIALSEGKPQYQQFHDQLLQDVTPYYRYRHSGSTDGLQALIESFKPKP
ncbi:MAG TPA: hypothetical protein VN643_16360 [Pyrinomonadaceae bacterium]|nr:hypothetical protein [Pyrinomonadaceae bacterium]